jgi:threonine/homoserine/homoserine lactone efflux protein
MKNLGIILGVVIAIVIAWWLVGVIFSLAWLIVKVVVVAAVAVLVFFALRGLLPRGSRE